ncbi:pilus assembly protein TadG-related protein, partial [Arthrospira platensis SPKY2]
MPRDGATRIDRFRHRQQRGEEGQILPLIALLLPILIMMLGMTIDIGFAQANQRRMQTAADMAALAGARSMSITRDVAVAEALSQDLLGSNGA